MRNLTVTEMVLSSKKGIDIPLSFGEMLAVAFSKRQSLLNVSRGNIAIYIFLLLLKNAFVCHGIFNMMSLYRTLELLSILTGSRFIWPTNNNNLDLLLIFLSWGVVLYFGLGFSPLSPTKSFLISITILTALPIFLPNHSFSELMVDFFCIANLIWYVLDQIWGRFDADIDWFVTETMYSLIFLALDATYGARGFLFDVFFMNSMCIPFVISAFLERKLIYALVLIGILTYSLYEKVNSHMTWFQIRDWQMIIYEDDLINLINLIN